MLQRKDNKYKELVGVGIVLSGVICFSTKAVFIKMAYSYEVDATILLMLRLLFALPAYLFLFFYSELIRPTPSKKLLFQSALWGLVGYYVASWLDFKGLEYISASMERLILFAYPTFVVLISRIFLKRPITKTQVLSLILAYTGIAIIILFKDGASTGSNYYLGALMILMSAFIYACYLIGAGELLKKVGTVKFTSTAMIFSTLGSVAHTTLNTGFDIQKYDREVYYLAAIMALIATVIPSLLISEGIKRIGASKAAIVGSAGPVSTLLLAYFLLGESINNYQILGTVCVIIGVIVISVAKKE